MIVFDSSALLAYLFDEPGAADIRAQLRRGGSCSAANWAEVAQKVAQVGHSWPEARLLLLRSGLMLEPVGEIDAEAAAVMWVKGSGLSLADRLCLALGARLGVDVLTCDTAWTGRPGVVVVR